MIQLCINFFKKTDHLVLKDSAWYFLSKLIPGILVFFGIFLFNRLYGSEVFGRFSLMMSAASTIAIISGSWLTQSQLKFVTFDRNPDIEAAVQKGAGFALGASVILTLIYILLKKLPLQDMGVLATFSCSIVLYNVLMAALMRSFHSKRVMLYEVLRNLLYVLIPVVFYFMGLGAYGLVVGVVLSYVCVFSFAFTNGDRYFGNKGSITKDSSHFLKQFLEYGWPLSISLGLLEGFRFVERLFLDAHPNKLLLGNYVMVSEVILRSFSLLFVPLTLALHPRFMAFWAEKDKARAMDILKKAVAMQCLIFCLFIVGLFLLGKPFFLFFFPAVPADVLDLLVVISISGFVWQLNSMVHKPLEASGGSRFILVGYMLAFIAQLLTYLLWGVKGSIVVYPMAQIAGSLMYLLWSLFVIGVSRKQLFKFN